MISWCYEGPEVPLLPFVDYLYLQDREPFTPEQTVAGIGL